VHEYGPLDNFPDEPKARPNWVCFALVPTSTGRLDKKPVNAQTGENAKSNDPRTWTSFPVATQAAKQGTINGRIVHGVGYVFWKGAEAVNLAPRPDDLPADDYVGIDLDHCVNPETGAIESWALDIVEVLSSYTDTKLQLKK